MDEEYRILDVEWLHDIWRPDSFFKNAKKVTFHEMSIPNHYLWLYRDKTLLYMAKYAAHSPFLSLYFKRSRIAYKMYMCHFVILLLFLLNAQIDVGFIVRNEIRIISP